MARKTSGCAWVVLAVILGVVGMGVLGAMLNGITERQEAAKRQELREANRQRDAAERQRIEALSPEQRKAEEDAKAAAAKAKADAEAAAAFAAATSHVDAIERRFQANAEKLKGYYGTSAQVKQATADLVRLAGAKGLYAESANSEERTLARRAEALISKVSQQQRVLYASATEEAFVKSGMDVKVTAAGSAKDQLRLKYVLMSKPLVYKFQNEVKLGETARVYGFKKIVYSDGYDESWSVDL